MFRILKPERLIFGLLLLLSGSALAQDPALFPRPPELEPAIGFWVRVYTEVDTRSGFLHDSQHLSVIYKALPLNRGDIESNRTRIQQELQVLASGKRDDLTQSQQDVLALWPENVSNQTLRTAASNVRWQLGQSDRFLGGLQRSGAYRQHINQVVREKGLPIELGVLPHVESSFNPGAFSSASAAGMWQFTRATGQRFMRIDHIVDERMDPYLASSAAMSLLEYNLSVLGTWPLALTAYNHGAGGIARAVRDTKTTDIETIIATYKGRAFGFASRNFYPQFLAVLQVENNARQYFGDIRLNPAPDFREVETDSYIDAEVFASSVGISLEQLRDDNRALRPVVWEGNKRIPKGFTMKVRREAVPEGNLLALISDDFKFPIQTPDIAYVVERGDSLSVIASRFNTSVGQLVSLNQLASRNRIAIGQRLLLPQDNSSPGTPGGSPQSAPSDGIYSVRRGDTVSLIAARYGVTEQALLGVNGLQDPHLIYPGQQLTLPGFESSTVQLAAADISQPPTSAEQEPAAALITETPAVALAETIEETILETPQADTVSNEPVPAEPIESSVALALNEQSLPPAAVLPDNQELDSDVTEEEGEAVALDPALDVAQSNEQLAEALSADPSDYTVASNNSVEIQASETLGHYADWLGIRAWDVRRLNSMQFRDPVIIGDRLKLDFSKVNIAEFELKRREFHSGLQTEFFANYRIQDVQEYTVRRNDNIGTIARNRYSTPIWLLRQYNPVIDFGRIQIGEKIIFPLLEEVN
ncbi:MAG: LysM peptidoglycan-binding domain-containing protein [Gammaproteobacteria bacterium]|jgi:membrane-bound lytic murein transglycosylase D|nr:LysM peptidoglycan-binding domain-containing protein [Gammaproteobacteria bacterium]MBT3860056.1 LysM peptidoglycan-binding domain-containing protein [Gammaproteobacteria bacterium]MBT3986994.1 LysM peptidoglycan-binding domain-containing protein [Gammaproteobacteria bacterium]MBT4255689.1 LysM peptidoglycan-binding domain-containing protein [Gammaproteobacteria bacterium]MBT4580741.1 LysM peptidoglycan-binding domain-containing protein [Gammaproteobacteria bacterium]